VTSERERVRKLPTTSTHTTTAVKHDSRQIQGKRGIYTPTLPAPPWWNNLLPRTFVDTAMAHGDFSLDFSIFRLWSSAEKYLTDKQR
jgi:hypothetical protein